MEAQPLEQVGDVLLVSRQPIQRLSHHHVEQPGAVCATVKLAAAYNNSKGNEDWSKWTPQGDISMMITNPKAIEGFELGKSYQVEFLPVDPNG